MHSILSKASISPYSSPWNVIPILKKFSFTQSSPPPSLIVRQLNFFELELHRRSSHRRTILSEQVSANSVAPIRKKILRCFPRRDHLLCLRGGGFSSGQDRRPYTTASQTSAIKRERRGVKLYCGRGGGSLLRAPLEKGCYNFIVTRCDRILSRGQLFRAARRDLFVRRAQKEKLSSRWWT